MGLMVVNGQLDGLVVLGIGLACYLWRRSRLAAGAALTNGRSAEDAVWEKPAQSASSAPNKKRAGREALL